MMKLRNLLAPSSLLLAIVACSGASSTELFGPAGSSQSGTEPGADDDGSSGTSPSGSSGGSGNTSSSSSSGSTGSTSSGGSSGSSGGEPKDAGKDAPPPTSAGTVHCAGPAPRPNGPNGAKTSCTAGAENCCRSWFGQGQPTYTCEPKGLVECAGATKIACDDRADCPTGQVCCGLLGQSTGYRSVECRTQCNNIGGLRAVRFCDPNAAVDECAPLGLECIPSQSLPGYNVCGD